MSDDAGSYRDLLELLDAVERRIEVVESFGHDEREATFELLEVVEALHRFVLGRLGRALGAEALDRLCDQEASVGWLFDAYGVRGDEAAAVEAVLAEVSQYAASHGGQLVLAEVVDGVVRIELEGACSGCPSSSVTLEDRLETELRERVPSFRRLEVVAGDRPGAETPPEAAPPGPADRGAVLVSLGPTRES